MARTPGQLFGSNIWRSCLRRPLPSRKRRSSATKAAAMPIESINPATGETLERYDEMTRPQVGAAIDSAHAAFLEWRKTTFAVRAEPMRKAAALLRERAREYGKLMALEMGKPIRDGIAEAQKCATGCEYYA